MAQITETKIALLQRPPAVSSRYINYQGKFTCNAGQELEIEGGDLDKFKIACPEGKRWDVFIRINVYEVKEGELGL